MITLSDVIADRYDLRRRLEADAQGLALAEIAGLVAFHRAQAMIAESEPVVAEAESKLADRRRRFDEASEALKVAEQRVRAKRSELALFEDVPSSPDEARVKRQCEAEINALVHVRNELKAELDARKYSQRKAEQELKAIAETVAILREVREPALAVLPVVVPGLA